MGAGRHLAFRRSSSSCATTRPPRSWSIDYISGFERENDDGTTTRSTAGRLKLFRNFDDYGNRLARPNTILIDSAQLESGEALDKDFREMAADEIEQFRREIVERTGDARAAGTPSTTRRCCAR